MTLVVPFASIAQKSTLTSFKTVPSFIENKGQIIDQNNKPNPGVLYLLNSPGFNVQLRRGGFSYDLYRISNPDSYRDDQRISKSEFSASRVSRYASRDSNSVISYQRIDFDLLNTNPNPTIETSTPSTDYLNYYTTGTPVGGVTPVRSYTTVTYKNIYPGIDLQFIANNARPFEYNFILQPGADIGSIKLKVSGPEKIKKIKEGIRCETSIGAIDETIPNMLLQD